MSESNDALRLDLQRLYAGMRQDMHERWNRDLPFGDLLFDRWERAQALSFGEQSSIYQSSYVYGDVKVGEHTWIGPFTILDGSAGLRIGRYCSISAGVQIYTHDSVRWALSGGAAQYERSAVAIGDCCYIGPHTVIARGTTIGDHVVVGANSFVNRDVPAFSIVAGSPCRVIGRVVVDGTDVKLRFEANDEPR